MNRNYELNNVTVKKTLQSHLFSQSLEHIYFKFKKNHAF